jgi:hypothetical protein
MMTHVDYCHHVPVESLLNTPRYASSSDMSSASSTFDLGSEQQEGKYMCLRIQDQNSNNSNVMSILSEVEDDCTGTGTNQQQELQEEEERRQHGLLLENEAAAVTATTTATTTTKPTNDVVYHDDGNNIIGRGWSITGRMDSLGGSVYLKDENGQVMAVVARECNAYAILGLTPVYEHQPPHRTKLKASKKPLYKWATVKKHRKSLLLWLGESYVITREDDKTSYVTKECGSRFGARKLKVVKDGRTCGLIEQFFTKGNVTSSEWKIQVGTDIGPRAMVCFLAIVNKSTGRLL